MLGTSQPCILNTLHCCCSDQSSTIILHKTKVFCPNTIYLLLKAKITCVAGWDACQIPLSSPTINHYSFVTLEKGLINRIRLDIEFKNNTLTGWMINHNSVLVFVILGKILCHRYFTQSDPLYLKSKRGTQKYFQFTKHILEH